MITDLQLFLPASIASYQIRYYPFNPHHLPAGSVGWSVFHSFFDFSRNYFH